MIIGMIKDAARYEVLSGRIAEALKWLQTVDTSVLQEGKNPIRGEDIFCSVHFYDTTGADSRPWEGHRKYIDIHFIIKGEEIIGISPIDAMQIKKDYDAQTDFIEFEGATQQQILLKEGMFLIAFPEDIHKTALQVVPGQACAVKKGIIKVLLDTPQQ
jgi:YhcH/YjgK/YiaL family protein